MNAPLAFELKKPHHADPDRTYPALFVMHGMGSNEKDMLNLVSGLEEHFYIFSIRGPIERPPGYAFFTIERLGKPHQEVFQAAVDKVSDFISWAESEYRLDASRIYLLGFSQGAILSMTIGLSLGIRIRGVVALSGYIPEFVKTEFQQSSMEGLSLFISHGEQDQALPFEWGQTSRNYFHDLGADVTFKNYPSAHTVSLQNYKDFEKWLLDSLA